MNMTEELLVQNKTVVVPGEPLAEGMGFLPSKGTYRDHEMIRAKRLGLVEIDGKAIKLVPLSGCYMPKTGDVIITQVFDVSFSGWRLDTATAYPAMLGVKDATSDFISRGADLTEYYNLGDNLVVKIINVTSQKLIDVTMKGPGLRKLQGGRIIKVNPNKVPRIIGKQGSMVSMIKFATNCKIIVGQNGLIWIDGTPNEELVAVNTIRMIEHLAHISGLTERVKTYLETQLGKKIEEVPPMEEQAYTPAPHPNYGEGEREHRRPQRYR